MPATALATDIMVAWLVVRDGELTTRHLITQKEKNLILHMLGDPKMPKVLFRGETYNKYCVDLRNLTPQDKATIRNQAHHRAQHQQAQERHRQQAAKKKHQQQQEDAAVAAWARQHPHAWQQLMHQEQQKVDEETKERKRNAMPPGCAGFSALQEVFSEKYPHVARGMARLRARARVLQEVLPVRSPDGSSCTPNP